MIYDVISLHATIILIRIALPNHEENLKLSWEEQRLSMANIVANVTPPVELGSWVQKVDDYIILDAGYDAALLQRVALKSFGWNSSYLSNNTGICAPYYQISVELGKRKKSFCGSNHNAPLLQFTNYPSIGPFLERNRK